ncbi:MAG: DUF86 domain-containing protein [Bryobacterales bacterium]|nr:DUF86 domain-containing protein [Bryobacterales bacterium]
MSVAEKYRNLPPLPRDLPERLARLPEVLERHPVRLAYLFGSAVHAPERSEDVDVAVLADEGFSYGELFADLSEELGSERLDLVDLRLAPPYLVAEILERGRPILSRSEEERLRFEHGKRSQWRESCWRVSTERGAGFVDIRPEFLEQAGAELGRVAQELEKYQRITEEDIAANLSLRWTVERGLLAGLTLIFQMADHILARAYDRTPARYEELLAELHSAGVISEELYRGLRGAGGFRNVLVHEYVAIDFERLVTTLHQAPATFRQFRQEIREWLNRRRAN